MLIYLDICSFNRPWDEQAQIKVRLETEAKLYIQDGIRQGRYRLVWSYMMDFENSESPYEDKKNAIQPWKGIAELYCGPSDAVLTLGQEIMNNGAKPKDALHVACAITSRCEYFITTDQRLINKDIPQLKIINPIDFIQETEGTA